jgi:peptidoglycan/xylan/chitin deacetylase (PgdA/CDA1 family)
LATVLPRRLFMTSGPVGSRAIALTFDDGPDPIQTPAVLDRLRALDLRATFFVIGSRMEVHPGLVRRMTEEGHEVGHHSWSHGPPHQTSAAALLDETRRTTALLRQLTGKPTRLCRPPNGKLTLGKLLGLWTLGQSVVLWNRDPKDYRLRDREQLQRWLETEPIQGGDIVLLHDTHDQVVPVLDALVERAALHGLGFTTPSEWIGG